MRARSSIDRLFAVSGGDKIPSEFGQSKTATRTTKAVRQRTASMSAFVGDIQSVALHLAEQRLPGHFQEPRRGGTIVEGMLQRPQNVFAFHLLQTYPVRVKLSWRHGTSTDGAVNSDTASCSTRSVDIRFCRPVVRCERQRNDPTQQASRDHC